MLTTCDRLASRYGGRPSDYLSSDAEALGFDLLCLRHADAEATRAAGDGKVGVTLVRAV